MRAGEPRIGPDFVGIGKRAGDSIDRLSDEFRVSSANVRKAFIR